MDKNQAYIQNLSIKEVPWHRLTTPYGRATDFPEYFKTIQNAADTAEIETALGELLSNIEHQGTLWHSTPFAMIFLARIFENSVSEMGQSGRADFIITQLLSFFELIAECFHDAEDMGMSEDTDPLPDFSDMLKEEYLWSEEYNEEEDEQRYEDGAFPDDLFYSFWFYSYQVLLFCKPMFKKLENTDFDTEDLLALL
ncbi:MAG: hypothetical protein K2N94_01710 [Lachnospiraceae bacterium]|nr:hypothetical protein [Lachnospiraceae bacterium]